MAKKTAINYRLNCILLVFGRLVSEFGSSVFGFALSLYVLDFTNSAAAFSLVLSFSILPNMFVNLIAGSFVDKHDKKKTIVYTDILSGIAVLTFMLMFHLDPKSILLLISYKVILAITQSFFGLAVSTSIPNIVGASNTARVNSISATLGSLVSILGPIVGAIAYKTIGLQNIFLIDGISFILSGISESFIVFEPKKAIENKEHCMEQSSEKEKTNYLSGIKFGFQYILKDKTTSFFIFLALLLNIVFSPLSALIIPYINYNVLEVSEVQLSIIQGSWAAGAIIGGCLMSIMKNTFFIIKRIFLLVQAQAIVLILFCFPNLNIPLFQSKWVITFTFSFLLILIGVLNVMQNVPLYTYFQLRVTEHLRGRVFAVFNITIMLSSTLGLWIFGYILDHVAWGNILLASGIMMFLLGGVLNRNMYFKQFTTSIE
ncbi:MFS transporter [Anaerosporobacter faecicola]|uniref:MFS transporter n=1 Tax=Anaerosporobacter faecicola TaxID=2718714 RepID=UPI00143A4384|nr:MFS transporter [Anaerosporobacter faecicola]